MSSWLTALLTYTKPQAVCRPTARGVALVAPQESWLHKLLSFVPRRHDLPPQARTPAPKATIERLAGDLRIGLPWDLQPTLWWLDQSDSLPWRHLMWGREGMLKEWTGVGLERDTEKPAEGRRHRNWLCRSHEVGRESRGVGRPCGRSEETRGEQALLRGTESQTWPLTRIAVEPWIDTGSPGPRGILRYHEWHFHEARDAVMEMVSCPL